MLKDFEYQWRPYYLIFKTATLKVKLPVGFPKKQMAQFWVASVPLTPRVTVYCHPIRSSDQIEMIMYSVTLICKSYACFSDFAVMVLVKNSIPGRLLFYMNAKSIFCINTHYLYTNLRIHHGSIYAHYRKVGINYRSIGTISCDWTKNVMSCVSCFCRKLKFLFDSRPFCNFDSAYSLFCHKKPVTILCRTRQYRVLYLPIDHQHRFLPR